MTNHRRLAGTALILGWRAWPHGAAAQAENTAGGGVPQHLGGVRFPTNCLPEAQSGFAKGVALLHSFQHEEARQTFAEVEKQDRKCAMAHGGEAMSVYHQLWDFPEAGKLEEGHKEVEAARRASWPPPPLSIRKVTS